MQDSSHSGSFRPYSASWANWLVSRWDNPRWPFWLPYALLALALLLLLSAVRWWEGSLRPGQFWLAHVVEAFLLPYSLFLVRYLERAAREALETIRPSLGLSQAQYDELEYQLTTAPSLPALLATLLGAGYGAFYWLVILKPLHPDLLWGTSRLSWWIDLPLQLFLWATLGVLFYTSFRQVRIIYRIYSLVEQINLMLPQPLYALSSYTLRAALSGTAYNYVWLATLLYAAKQVPPGVVAVSLTAEALVVAVFAIPLWGIHQLLLEEKRRLQSQLYERIRQTTGDLHQSIDEGNLERVDPIQKALASLQVQQGVLDQASTWPWRPETFRILSTAIAAPLLIWLTQRVLNRLVG